MADEKPAPPPAPRPTKIRLTHAHGFIDEDGRDRFWKAGTVISGEDEIDLLTGRGALHETVA
jgi:hypothetical protein